MTVLQRQATVSRLSHITVFGFRSPLGLMQDTTSNPQEAKTLFEHRPEDNRMLFVNESGRPHTWRLATMDEFQDLMSLEG